MGSEGSERFSDDYFPTVNQGLGRTHGIFIICVDRHSLGRPPALLLGGGTTQNIVISTSSCLFFISHDLAGLFIIIGKALLDFHEQYKKKRSMLSMEKIYMFIETIGEEVLVTSKG